MIFEMPECGGCRTCEMACSFYHTKLFKPSVSSLKILDKANLGGYRIELAEISEDGRLACNGCPDLSVPLCLEYCKESEALKKILKIFLEQKKSNGSKEGNDE